MKILFLVFFLLAIGSCTVYRSPDRKDFESESNQFRVQNLKKVECSSQSIRSQSERKRLVTILPSKLLDKGLSGSEFLWEYKIQGHSVFESDTLTGVYCIYEQT